MQTGACLDLLCLCSLVQDLQEKIQQRSTDLQDLRAEDHDQAVSSLVDRSIESCCALSQQVTGT